MKNNLIEIIRGNAAPGKVLLLGYALPAAVLVALIFLGKPIQWGPAFPTILLGLLAIQQLVMVVALWRSAKGNALSVAGVLARATAAFAVLTLLPLGILTLKVTSLNCGDGGDCIIDSRSATTTTAASEPATGRN